MSDAAPPSKPVPETPLLRRIAAQIAAEGPIPFDRYMALCLGDPEHGYYTTRDPLGGHGDFTTAPEISQIFGEVIGAWCAAVWQLLGCPPTFALVELGPGRGTLAADLLRAIAVLPDARRAARLHLVEISPILRARQQATLLDAHPALEPTWHERVDTLPDLPAIIVANEFFDALPVRQFVRRGQTWRERAVGLASGGQLGWVELPPGDPPRTPASPPEVADVLEVSEPAEAVAEEIGRRLAARPGALLAIDYGHAESGYGDTVQALARHAYAEPLSRPGEQDLTAHVDFEALARALRRRGAWVGEARPQGRFLLDLGAERRLAALVARASDETRALTLRSGLARLVEPGGMGTLFKVLAAASSDRSPAARVGDMMLTSALLDGLPGLRHGFFTRQGGVSRGLYASLNVGLASGDEPERVRENRRLAAAALDLPEGALTTLRQVHSARVHVVEESGCEASAEGDGLVTARPGVALGILSADCVPVLMVDPAARIIGAAHAGWKGALAGIVEATVDAMCEIGAERSLIRAAIGPAIQQQSYEVGLDLRDRFLEAVPSAMRFFVPGRREGRVQFDLPGFVAARLEAAAVGAIDRSEADTAADPDRFFSFRRATLAGEPAYGRGLSAIALVP